MNVITYPLKIINSWFGFSDTHTTANINVNTIIIEPEICYKEENNDHDQNLYDDLCDPYVEFNLTDKQIKTIKELQKQMKIQKEKILFNKLSKNS
jgi:hypothetical protein